MKQRYFTVLALISTLVLILSGCGPGDTGPGGSQTSAAKAVNLSWQNETPLKQPVTATISSTQTVTAGDLTTQQVKVSLPAGTLSSGTKITLTTPENAPVISSSVGAPIGAPVSISAGEQPTRLKQLMTVTLKFDPARLPAGTTADNLWATYYDSKAWRVFRPDSVDLRAGTITFTTDHLTFFGKVQVSVDERIEQAIHSKVVAETVQKEVFKNNIDDFMEKAIDTVLVDGLGMDEKAVKTKILGTLLKDDEWGDIKDGLCDEKKDLVKVAQATNILVGKAIAQNVGSTGLEALVGGPNVKESLKRGEGIDWVKSISQAAAFVAEGRYRDAGEILGGKIAMETPTVKAAAAAREVIQWRMDLWRDDKVEQAYKTFRFGSEANRIIGVRDVEAEDFNGVWDNSEALTRQLMIEAIERENKQRREDGRSLVSTVEEQKIRAGVRTEMEKQFKERAKQDAEIDRQKANLGKLLKDPDFVSIMNGPAVFDPGMSMESRVDRMAHFQEIVLNDTRGKYVSNNLMAQLALQWFGTANKEQARLNYAKMLKEKLGVTPAWLKTIPTPTTTTVASPKPTVTPTPTATAKTTSPPGMWVLVKRSELKKGNDLGWTNAIFNKNSATAMAGRGDDNAAKYTGSWPDPPASLPGGQVWSGSVSLKDAGSKWTEDYFAKITFMANDLSGGAIPVYVPGGQTTSLKAAWIEIKKTPDKYPTPDNPSFQWKMPSANDYSGTIIITATTEVGAGTACQAIVKYTYELRK